MPLPAFDYKSARILEEIDRDQGITQRKLAQRLGIALGVTNSYVRRLIRKGHLKATTLPRHRLKYFVTPSGLALKARLTYEYVSGSLDFYRDARVRGKSCIQGLMDQGVRRVGFLGVGDLAEILYLTLQETPMTFAGIFDDAAAGSPFFQTKVRPEMEIPGSGAERLLYTKPNWTSDVPYRGPLPVIQLYG